MTSVQNLLLRSNGNKLVFGLLIFLGACSVFKGGSPQEPQTIPETTSEANDTTAIVSVDTQSVKFPLVRPTYELALILPFFLNTLEAVMFDTETEDDMMLPPKSHLSLEFYEGILIGLDSLQNAGMKAKMYVFDSNHDTSLIRNLIGSKRLDKMDLIIGPVFNNCLKQVAQLSKDRKIPLLSPLSPADYLTSQNPNFVLCNPSLKVHLRKIAEHVKSHHPYAKVLILSSSGTYEQTISKTLEGYLGRKSDTSSLISHLDNKTSIASLESKLKDSVTNVILVPSFDEPFVNNILTKLSGLVEDHTIVLYGMPTWMNYKSLRIEYMVNLNLHLTQSFWAKHLEELNKPFTKRFHNKYKAYPTPEAFKGYYTALLVGWILEGGGIGKPIPSQLSEIYDIQPSKKGGQVDLYENRSIKMLHISDLVWVEAK